ARNLALSVFKTMRDSSSPAAPRNDTPNEFFRSLLEARGWVILDFGLQNCVIPSAARNLAPLSGQGTKFGVRALKNYYVYIMASTSRTLYTGVTNNLERRVLQHRRKLLGEVTARYNINRLVYYEVSGEILAAIAREKQIKSWSRKKKKIALIESVNRDWKDLSDAWCKTQGGVAGAQVEEIRAR